MNRLLRISISALILMQAAPSGFVSAEDDSMASYSNYSPNVQSQPTPQGPQAVQPIPLAQLGASSYQPIPQSMLPQTISSVVAVPGQQANVPVPSNLGGPLPTTGPYTLGRDDVVGIVVQGQPDFTGTYIIGPNGAIQYGYLGDVQADGLTKEQLAEAISEQLKKYIRIPSVSVTILGFNSKAVYIFGRVSRPGKYAMRGDSVRLRDAVIAAGLAVKHAKLRKVHIVKSAETNPTYRTVDLFNVIYKGKMEQDIELVNGDVIVIPTTVWGGISDFISDVFGPGANVARTAAIGVI